MYKSWENVGRNRGDTVSGNGAYLETTVKNSPDLAACMTSSPFRASALSFVLVVLNWGILVRGFLPTFSLEAV